MKQESNKVSKFEYVIFAINENYSNNMRLNKYSQYFVQPKLTKKNYKRRLTEF